MTELGYFLGDLKAQLSQSKPTDKVAFAQKYFENCQPGLHVIGMPYNYITECNYNRRAFVAIMIQSFSGFEDLYDITSNDFFILVETLSPGFPKSLILEVSQTLQRSNTQDGGETKHQFKNISIGLYCYLLYEDWLRLVTEYFVEESSGTSLNALKLKSKLEDFHCSISPTLSQPPLEAIHTMLDSIHPSPTGISSYQLEISLEQFRKAFYSSEVIRNTVLQQCC